jgi:hypothetical protein
MTTGTTPRWLLLAHQLPAGASNARVKTWRRLQQVGAVSVRNSVYVLPNTDQCREDFEWLRSEIAALGGGATVFAADAVDAGADEEIIAAFRRARDADYEAIAREAARLTVPGRRAQKTAAIDPPAARALAQLRERVNAVRRIDFFNAPRCLHAADAIDAVERRLRPPAETGKEPAMRDRLSTTSFTKRRWVTRQRPGVDRMASAWLIRRHIDPSAAFGFVDQPAESDVPFDMYVGDFSHRGTLCTFEVLADRFGIRDAAVRRLAEIVHDIDMKEDRYAAPETAAIARMVEGLRQLHSDDAILLEQGIAMFEALARSFASTADRRKESTRRSKGGRPRSR